MQESRKKIINRLKTIKGHIAGVEKMVEEGKPCADILMQVTAIKSSVHKVGVAIIEDNALQCFIETDEDKIERTEVERVFKMIVDYSK